MRFLLFFALFDHLFRRLPVLGALMGLSVWVLLALAIVALAGCGNVTRPLPYTSVDDPVISLPSVPGNEITHPPVAANSRIRNGL